MTLEHFINVRTALKVFCDVVSLAISYCKGSLAAIDVLLIFKYRTQVNIKIVHKVKNK